jgi:hypothetical protein
LEIKLSRLQLYNEIWEFSVAGVAKKYNLRYSDLHANCKDWDIPVPYSGYWTKLSYGKPVSKTPLPESTITEVLLSSSATPKRLRQSKKDVEQSEHVKSKSDELSILNQSEIQAGVPSIVENELPMYQEQEIPGKYNTYNQQKLYEEVWQNPLYKWLNNMVFQMCLFTKYVNPYKY